MPSTFVHAFLPSLSLFPIRPRLGSLTKSQWMKLLLIGAILGNSPDWDIIPACFAGDDWKMIHRALGHNLLSLGCLIVFGKWALNRFIGRPLTHRQSWLLSIGLVASHVFLDAMQDVNPEGAIRGVPLLWPVSSWEFSLPFRLFKILKLKPDIHFLWAHITSHDFWSSAIFYEIWNSAVLWVLWYSIVKVTFWIQPKLSLKETTETKNAQIVSLDLSSSPQYTPEPPSHRRQDDTPNRKDINCR